MSGRDCAERRRVAAAGNFRRGGIRIAACGAVVLAHAAGEDAVYPGRAGVCHGDRDGQLRAAGARGARVPGGPVGIEIEGDVGRLEQLLVSSHQRSGISEQWLVVRESSSVLLTTSLWPLV